MLTVERRFMIKHWYDKGLSISEIARLSGHDRKTIRKALEEPLTAMPRPRKPRVRSWILTSPTLSNASRKAC